MSLQTDTRSAPGRECIVDIVYIDVDMVDTDTYFVNTFVRNDGRHREGASFQWGSKPCALVHRTL